MCTPTGIGAPVSSCKGRARAHAKAQQPWRKRLVSFGASGTFKIGRERADKWLELKRQHNAPYSRTTAWVCARFGECACRCTNGRDAGNARQYGPAPRKSITFDTDTAFAQHALLRTMRAMTTCFCDAYASWQKAGSKTRTVDYAASCLVRSTSTKRPTKKFRTRLPPISRPESAWALRPLSRRSSKSLAKTCKSGSHSPVHLV